MFIHVAQHALFAGSLGIEASPQNPKSQVKADSI